MNFGGHLIVSLDWTFYVFVIYLFYYSELFLILLPIHNILIFISIFIFNDNLIGYLMSCFYDLKV